MAVQIPGGMTAHVEPINIADLLYKRAAMQGQQQENDHRQQLLGMKQQELAKQQRFADLLGGAKQITPEVVQQAMGIDPENGMRLADWQRKQQDQTQQDSAAFHEDIYKTSAAAKQAITNGANPEQVTQWAMSELQAKHPQQAGQLKPELFLQHLDANAMRGGYEDPNAKLRQGMQAKVLEQQALLPGLLAQKEQEKQLELKYPKPMSDADVELKQARIDDMKLRQEDRINKFENERADAISNIDDTIDEFKALKEIQDRTTTGPISGSAPVAFLRKMGPNALTGGEDLQRLEKGYNNLAIKAIGAFKAGGVSFGQLSNKEGEWIKSTQQTIDTGGEINQEMLNKGLKLLEDRKKRIAGHRGPGGGGMSVTAPSKYQIGQTATGPGGVKMVYTEQGWQKQ